MDASGSNPEWVLDRIEAAEESGYTVSVIYVDTPVEVCLYRNRQRALSEELAHPSRHALQRKFGDLNKVALRSKR